MGIKREVESQYVSIAEGMENDGHPSENIYRTFKLFMIMSIVTWLGVLGVVSIASFTAAIILIPVVLIILWTARVGSNAVKRYLDGKADNA